MITQYSAEIFIPITSLTRAKIIRRLCFVFEKTRFLRRRHAHVDVKQVVQMLDLSECVLGYHKSDSIAVELVLILGWCPLEYEKKTTRYECPRCRIAWVMQGAGRMQIQTGDSLGNRSLDRAMSSAKARSADR